MPDPLIVEGELGLYETEPGNQPADIRLNGAYLDRLIACHLGIEGTEPFSIVDGGQYVGTVRLTLEWL